MSAATTATTQSIYKDEQEQGVPSERKPIPAPTGVSSTEPTSGPTISHSTTVTTEALPVLSPEQQLTTRFGSWMTWWRANQSGDRSEDIKTIHTGPYQWHKDCRTATPNKGFRILNRNLTTTRYGYDLKGYIMHHIKGCQQDQEHQTTSTKSVLDMRYLSTKRKAQIQILMYVWWSATSMPAPASPSRNMRAAIPHTNKITRQLFSTVQKYDNRTGKGIL